jgi:hypothetical protein
MFQLFGRSVCLVSLFRLFVWLLGLIWFVHRCSRYTAAPARTECLQNLTICVLDACCRHTACPLLIAGRCDGPASSVTPRPWGRTYHVWSIFSTVQFSFVAVATLSLWTTDNPWQCFKILASQLLRTLWLGHNWILNYVPNSVLTFQTFLALISYK